jgi:hypothetical protein
VIKGAFEASLVTVRDVASVPAADGAYTNCILA